MTTMRSFICGFLFLSALSLDAQWIPANPVTGVQRESGGVVLTMGTGAMRIDVCTPSIIRVRYSPDSQFPERHDYVVVKNQWASVPWQLQETGREVEITTASLKVTVQKSDGTVAYFDPAGRSLLMEGPKQMTPVTVNGESVHKALDVFKVYGSEEAFYGLGQHQAGVWNYRGESVNLLQENTNIAVPFWLSSKGYGIFWNNDSASRFNNRFIQYLYVTSDVADVIDYYFFYGPQFDKIIADYRELTGQAPLFGKWAYGYWQCKNRYKSQAELLGIAKKYRDLGIPIDNLVQDWFWWTRTGEFVFNKNYPDPKGMLDELHREHFHLMISVWPFFYPGTKTYDEMDKLGYFIDRTKQGAFHPKGTAVYDAFNPAARKFYWGLLDNALFKIGVDAWWMDTTEPETEGIPTNLLQFNKVAIGNGARYANLFPLMTTGAVYHGQRSESDQKRVFILSRSAFAGIQRNAVTAWSGDILSDWLTLKRQVPAALNFELSGIPYWTSDIGGFIMGHPNDPKYRELFVRWFQFGTFCPIFRVHGTRTPDVNELWSYGPQAQKILVSYDRLRYRLMPYIYSMAWMITHDSYTPMRPLIMDFADDPRVKNIGDQFMFGPAILVTPVTEEGATTRRLYLPAGTRWYDFWTGDSEDGGKFVVASAPLSRMPLYVRAGSIIPMGPDIQYTDQKPADPIEVRVYPGASGEFTLYEDQNDTYNYEKGVYATIPMQWNDATRTLTIGARHGSFPGMLQKRTFRIVFAGAGHGIGGALTAQADKVVDYSGSEVTVTR
jgi:alpha-D-xyloside xylohydrolase